MPDQHYRVASYRAGEGLGHLLRRVYALMHERMQGAFAGQDLTLMQWIVLTYLRDGLARTASDFTHEFRHDSGALTRLVDQLEKRGLLVRRRSTSDRRAVELELTRKGRATVDALVPVVVDQMNDALAPFSRTEYEELRALLVRLVNHLEEPRGPSTSEIPERRAPRRRK